MNDELTYDEQLLTTDELAAKLKLPKSWIYARSRIKGDDAIPRIKAGRYLRWQWSAVLAWIERTHATVKA